MSTYTDKIPKYLPNYQKGLKYDALNKFLKVNNITLDCTKPKMDLNESFDGKMTYLKLKDGQPNGNVWCSAKFPYRWTVDSIIKENIQQLNYKFNKKPIFSIKCIRRKMGMDMIQ